MDFMTKRIFSLIKHMFMNRHETTNSMTFVKLLTTLVKPHTMETRLKKGLRHIFT